MIRNMWKQAGRILFGFAICVNAYANVKSMSAPPNREHDKPAPGYAICLVLNAGVYNGTWMSAHQVCKYDLTEKNMWVSGYWACDKYLPDKGTCEHWSWIKAHWANSVDIPLQPDSH